MQNKKLTSVLAAAFVLAVLTFGAASAWAHNGIEHVMGTLSAKSDTFVTVDTPKHKMVTVLLDKTTTFSFNDKTAALGDLKLGDRVVVNAKEGADLRLHGLSVRWGANATDHADHDDHT